MARIVYANTIGYDFGLQQRPHHIFNELAKRGHEILWVDPHNKKRKNTQFKKKINDNLTVFYDWNKFCSIYKDRVDVYYATWANRWEDIDRLNPKFVLYDSLDLFPNHENNEKKMVDKADEILVTAEKLKLYHEAHTKKRIHMCENGCFNKHRKQNYVMPDIIKQLKDHEQPVILFSGALALSPNTGWVDIDLLREITKKYYIVVVGKVWGINEEYIKHNQDVFSKMLNVGIVDHETLQSY